MLSDAHRKELKSWGTATVRAHLSSYPGIGGPASVPGFKSGEMTRSDITDWLIERTKAEQRQQAAILISAIVAAVASAVAVVIGVIALTLHK
jgi:hypothetical protein